jgi:3-keto-L-gulonate-6-phosphate decarboxylase
VTLKIGELHADEAHFILDELKAVDAGRTELAAARKEIADGVAALAAKRARQEEEPEATQAPAAKPAAVLRKSHH